ncbi:MAG: cytochrome D ubiquinol oxidase subunit II, partial [Planctomycetes bacterium]|nr:cytochrome D ubiquinol oxidase subunit II [Planctomycetota bacterium]
MTTHRDPPMDEDSLRNRLGAVIREAAEGHEHGSPTTKARRRRHVEELALTAMKMLGDGMDVGQVKLIELAVKEMRRAYRLFNRYRGVRKVSIFGSARTPATHPDYHAARTFGQLIAAESWMAITGAGDGIMKAGHEGPRREASFGLSIRLPFETNANEVIAGDEKLL